MLRKQIQQTLSETEKKECAGDASTENKPSLDYGPNWMHFAPLLALLEKFAHVHICYVIEAQLQGLNEALRIPPLLGFNVPWIFGSK
jgi:hypothetical protein